MEPNKQPRNPALHPVFRDLVNNLSRSLPAYTDRVVDAIQVPALLPDYFVGRMAEDAHGDAMSDAEPME